jgi:hypothetical protein
LTLGRDIDSIGLSNAQADLAAGATLTDVALGVLNSHERHADLVNGYYEQFLHRAADPMSANFVALFDAGATDQEVIAQLIGNASLEFFNKTAS